MMRNFSIVECAAVKDRTDILRQYGWYRGQSKQCLPSQLPIFMENACHPSLYPPRGNQTHTNLRYFARLPRIRHLCWRITLMTRKTTFRMLLALAMTGTMMGAGSAKAFCIDNKTSYNLRVNLETPSPYGKFVELFRPGKKACCSWFNQRCNPTRQREGLLMFSVRSKPKARTKLYCASGWTRRIYASASGTIVITENRGSLGGLRCDSRDLSRQKVTQQSFLKHYKKNKMPLPIIVPPRPGS